MFPTLVYKSPGSHFGPNGKTYSYLGVNDEAALNAAIESGWNPDFQEVIGLKKTDDVVEMPESKLPTREELIAQAEKLGIKIDKRWGDEKIAEMIGKT